MKKRTGGNIFKLCCALLSLEEEDKPRHFGYTKLLSAGKPSKRFDTFLWEELPLSCYAGKLPFNLYLRGIFRREILKNGHGLGPQGQRALLVPSSIC